MIPLILIYSSVFLVSQALYNIAFDYPTNDIVVNFSYVEYNPYLLYIAAQCIAIVLLSIFWRFSRRHSAAEDELERIKRQEAADKRHALLLSRKQESVFTACLFIYLITSNCYSISHCI